MFDQIPNRSMLATAFTDCECVTSGAHGFTTTVSGTGAAVSASTVDAASHFGVISLDTGTTTNGYATINTHASSIQLGGGEAYFEAMVQIPDLDDGTDTYAVRIGLGDVATGAAPTDGIFFSYIKATSTKFILNNRSNSSSTTYTTSTTVAEDTWYKLGILVDAGGTKTTWFINGSYAGELAGTIPAALARQTGLSVSILKTAGTTARTLLVDYIYFLQKFTTPR